MEKINLVEILKDCPKGMELDCTLYENVEFDYIEHNPELAYPIIHCVTKTNGGYNALVFTHNGCNDRHPNAKCVIFPKGKTTWEGFHRPFKDGDIIFTHANCLKVGLGNTWISIFQEKRNGGVATYVDMTEDGKDYYDYIDGNKGLLCMNEDIMRQRLATEEEKQKLFDAIKANGYKWNTETKTLEKLNVPIFKVGDKIRYKGGNRVKRRIVKINNREEFYYTDDGGRVYFMHQDDWEFVPDKFDITTLKPFESRVLMRNTELDKWSPGIWGYYDKPYSYPYKLIGTISKQCIPYERNEYLLGTTNDCDEFYKTWE